MLEGERALGVLLLFEDFLAGDDNVAALLVELDDTNVNRLADVGVQVAYGTNLQLRTGQECLDADIDRQSTLDPAQNDAGDRSLVVGCLLDCIPYLMTLSLFIAQDIAALGLFALDDDFHRIACLQLRLAGVVENLFERNQSFGLHPDIDNDMLVRELDHGSSHDAAVVKSLCRCLCRLFAIEGFECGGKIFHAAEIDVFCCFGRGFDRCGYCYGGFSGVSLRVMGDFDGRIGVIRRGFQRWGFQFGVQRIALDLFRIKDVCHNCQLRDFGRRSRKFRPAGSRSAGQFDRLRRCRFLRG